jgi:AcrR family transcriptional regulator
VPSRQASPVKRHRDRDSTQRDILEVATSEFAQHGFDGGRVDEIAARTRTTKRMIYYYFGSKEELYITVLKRAYVTIREAEQELDVDESDPKAAIRRLAELTFDHHESHPDFIRLVSIENIAHGAHMTKGTFGDLNNPVIELIGKILARGYDEGVFHRRIDPLDLHLMMSSFSYFRVANRYTFTAVFDRDPLQSERRAGYRRMLGDMVVDYLTGSADSRA